MKTSLLSLVAALTLFTTAASATTLSAAPVAPLHVADHHNDPRYMSRAERARYEAEQRRIEKERQRRVAAERARLERERRLAAERARREQQRRYNDPHNHHDYGYTRH